MGKPSKGTSKDRRLKANKKSKKKSTKRKSSGVSKLRQGKSMAFQKVLIY